MLEWVLYIAATVNSKDGLELAHYETLEECEVATRKLWIYGDAVARENRGEGQASDLYGFCLHKDAKLPRDLPH